VVDVHLDLCLFKALIGNKVRGSVDCAIADPHES